jgi:hypothetical protein
MPVDKRNFTNMSQMIRNQYENVATAREFSRRQLAKSQDFCAAASERRWFGVSGGGGS